MTNPDIWLQAVATPLILLGAAGLLLCFYALKS